MHYAKLEAVGAAFDAPTKDQEPAGPQPEKLQRSKYVEGLDIPPYRGPPKEADTTTTPAKKEIKLLTIAPKSRDYEIF